MFDRTTQHRVRQTREGASRVVLAVAQRLGFRLDLLDGVALSSGILCFKGAAGVVEAAKLDGDAGADPYEGSEGSLVKCACAFVLQNLGGAVQSAGIFRCGLEADFDNVLVCMLVWVLQSGSRSCGHTEWLAWSSVSMKDQPKSRPSVSLAPISTCATPPTAPANRSFNALDAPAPWSASSIASAIAATSHSLSRCEAKGSVDQTISKLVFCESWTRVGVEIKTVSFFMLSLTLANGKNFKIARGEVM